MTALAMAPHKDYTQGTQIRSKPKYNIEEGKHTFGEKLYDWTNYGVVGYGAVLGLSLYLTEYFMHRGGKAFWEATDKPFSEYLAKHMDPQKAKDLSYGIHKYGYTTMGGNLLMLPMLWAENNKSKLVYLANRKFAPGEIANDDPYKDLSAKQILKNNFDENQLPQPANEQPKHGLLNAAWRRALAVTTITFAWGPLMEGMFGKDGIEKMTLDKFDKAVEASGSKTAKDLSKNKRLRYYTGLTVVDGINTVVTSLVIWATNGTKKRKSATHTDPETVETTATDNHEAVEPLPVVTPQQQAPEPKTLITSPDIQSNSLVESSLDKEEAKNFKELTKHASHVDTLDSQTTESSLSV